MKSNAIFPSAYRKRSARFFHHALIIVGIILFTTGNSTAMDQGRTESALPVIVIHAKRFAFIPSQITLEAGKAVRLVFVTDDITHSVAVPGLGIDMPIWRFRSNQIVVTPAATGDFAGECTRYCGIGHDRMKFVVHVVR